MAAWFDPRLEHVLHAAEQKRYALSPALRPGGPTNSALRHLEGREAATARAQAPQRRSSCRASTRDRGTDARASQTARRCGSAQGWAASWRGASAWSSVPASACGRCGCGRGRRGACSPPRWAGGHAGEAREAAVDVIGDRRGDRALLEHLLDQIDAAARAIALIAEQHIGRTSCGAEAAMDAALQHGVGPSDGRVLELLVGEIGVHG